jgi:hypothetical protein
MEAAFRGRKSHPIQNVMAAVDFVLRFTFVMTEWEGTTHDAPILRDALERENGLRIPEDQFILSFDHEHYTNHFKVNMWLHLCI